MVIEFHAPIDASLSSLLHELPIFLAYILSFVFIAIYWNNHHHLIHTTEHAHGDILWANIHLLFWLSLVPFATSWIGKFPGEAMPTFVYSVVLLAAAIAYTILVKRILKHDGKNSPLAKALGKDIKGKISLLAYLLACLFAFYNPIFSYGLFILVSLMWTVPDKRIEKFLNNH
jgi:uncharacterized membrane protein